ncbi:LacI family DNA-binding transcriptional regulator [Alkalicella caledoniensis]|uniref:LacI family DNA-binding transcriptional regulator n=1 Tax=Alkalicella caledoniensis TaxID=2731377 RepID=A0A7G9W9W4_ALKCA|nr:LacI family DNA-binding transcriptional regulator [Alkalicella caledoniensis]QNO15476.1 LacI family DNA-binding transcriptional regulator [Alkalicella caledoniensis]
MKTSGAVTIKDVAKMAGVSPSTVSRVISRNPKITPETSEKVLKCMKELGYYPNAIARSLASKKSGTIGVIMPTTSEDVLLNPFFPEALRGIAKAASKAGYDLLLSTNAEKGEELKVIKNFIRGSKVDGIILMSSKVNDECIEFLTSLDFPFSLIGSPHCFSDKINHVDNDNYMAAYELTRHLSMTGRRKKIAMIAGDEKLTVTQKRIEGYKKALEESNIPFKHELLFMGSFDEKTGYKYGSIIADLDPRPDAVIVTDDVVAFAAVRLFESLDVKIPEDIAVASFNNSILSRYSNTPITSVDVNAAKLGKESMKLLVEAMESGVRGSKVITPYTLHKRKSTEG